MPHFGIVRDASSDTMENIRFSVRTLLLMFALLSLALAAVRYFVFSTPLVIHMMPASAINVPEEGAFKANGQYVPTAKLSELFTNYTDKMHGRFSRARLQLVYPATDTKGLYREANHILGTRGFEAGFDEIFFTRASE